jgi:pyruvate,water dikinase
MNQLLGVGLIFILCPLMGAFLGPSERSMQRQSTGRSRQARTWAKVNWSQRRWEWEMIQGVLAVGIAKLLFPHNPEWDMIALMGVATGRFWQHRPGGILMMLAGYILHNPLSGVVVLILGAIGSIIFRENRQIALVWLMLMPLITAVRDAQSGILVLLTAGLAGILYGLDQRRSPAQAQTTAQLFRADSLTDVLDPRSAGQLATNLACLKQQGLPVPMGWVIYPGDDPESLAQMLRPLGPQTWVVRSSFARDQASEAIRELPSLRAIWLAIVQLFESHAGEGIAAIVQPQVDCLYTGTVYCQAPTLKADVPTPVAEQVLAVVDRLNQQLNTLETLEWAYDGQQVWILQVR